MAFDPKPCAQAILEKAGGQQNLLRAAHCATRLRLEIAAIERADIHALEDIEGVKGVFYVDGQLQIILGTGAVNKVYKEFMALTGTAEGEPTAAQPQKKSFILLRLAKHLGSVFVPILPAIMAAGLLVGLLQLLGSIDPDLAATDGYAFLKMVGSTAYDYLPVLVALSAARVFGGSQYLAAVVGLCMIHPNLISAWAAGDYFGPLPTWNLLGVTVTKLGYQGHVIPVVIAVWLLSLLENWLHEHVPEMIDLFVTPLVSVLVTTFCTFTFIGPVFAAAENLLLQFVEWLLTVGYGIGGTVLGGIYSATVVCGLHHIYDILEAGMVSGSGLNILMPIASAANIAQGGACLAVGVRARGKRTRGTAVPAAISAILGITEPAIFGVNLRFGKPFVCAMAGGAAGALVAALTGVSAGAYGVTTLPGFLILNKGCGVGYALSLLTALAVSFVLTLMTWREEDPYTRIRPLEKLTGQAAQPGAAQTAAAPDAPAAGKADAAAPAAPQPPRTAVIRCEAGAALQPTAGEVIPLAEVPDPTFAAGYLGQGVGIRPADGVVYAPFDGTVASVAVTGHSLGLRGANGMEVLIHVGIDTVNLNGQGFALLVQQDEPVTAGQPLLRFDPEAIRAAGLSDVVVVTLVNSFQYSQVSTGPDAAAE